MVSVLNHICKLELLSMMQNPLVGPVKDITLIESVILFFPQAEINTRTIDSIQCNGDSVNGNPGSSPAPIFATISAGSDVRLNWTANWPTSHVVKDLA
jgi:hypothetical protein